jgi:hypothetical protein
MSSVLEREERLDESVNVVQHRMWPAAAWLAVALAGQAAGLQLLRAGPTIGFQRYAPPAELLGAEEWPWLAFVLAQALVVGVAGRRTWAAAWRWLREVAPVWRSALVLAVFVLSGAVVERSPSAWAIHLLLGGAIQIIALGTVVLFVRAATRGHANEAPPASAGNAFAWAAAAFVFVLAAALGYVAYEWHPHVPDELVYLLHARYFADGMLAMPAPPVPAAFELDLFTYEAGRWYSPVPPGWPAVLAVGVRLGVPWLVNPALGAASVLLASSLVRGLYDERTARLTTLLLGTSPWFLFMSMNLMTHTLTLFAALAAAVAAMKLIRNGRIAWALPAGACLGVLALIRPLEALIAAALLALWVVRDARGSLRFGAVAAMGAAAMATAALTLPYNAYLTGRADYFPIMAYTDALYGAGSNALGFGANRGLPWQGLDPFPGHGARDVVVNTLLNGYQVNVELLGWGTGSLAAILALLVIGRMRRADRMMLIAIIAVVGAHAFYWFSGGPDFGARYWYLMLVPAIVLAARGVQELDNELDATSRDPNAAPAMVRRGGPVARRSSALIGALALSGAALLVFVPWRAIDKYHHYRGMRPDIRELAATHDFGESLVLVRGRRFPDYASAAAYNPIDLRAPVAVYAWDRSPEVRRAVLSAYADRPVWIVAGPTVTGDGFRVERGPVSARQLLGEEAE